MRKTSIAGVALILSTFLLNGCIMERIEHQERINSDEEDYRKCLLAHTDEPAVCDPLKDLLERDKAAGWTG